MVITFTNATRFTSGNRIRHAGHDGQNQGLSDKVALVISAETGILITVITGFEYHPMSRLDHGQSGLAGPDTGTARRFGLRIQVIAVMVA
jgi:hypothetical protein